VQQPNNNDFPIYNRTIREVSAIIGVPQYVLRFWENKFSDIVKPTKNKNRRCYSDEDIEMLHKIRNLLHDQGYTIKAAQNLFNADLFVKNNNINIEKKEMNMEEVLDKPIAQHTPMQTQLESLVIAASNEIIKSGTQHHIEKERLKETLEKLYNIRKKLSEMI
jgi:DNA-binding transcriptional MerR regulator